MWKLTVALAGMLAASVTLGVPSASATTSQAAAVFGSNWTVYHGDALGSGVDTTGTNLDPAQQAWTSPALDGQLYGEPLVEDGLVIVATENNTVYALAANTGAVIWSRHIATPVSSNDLPCGTISPSVGITSTPVIDPALGEIFVVDDQLTGTSNASHYLVGLNLLTGAVLLDQSVDPPGSHPLYQLQRPGLALDDGKVIIGFGGNNGDCESDANPYHGWLVAVPEGGGSMQTFEVASAAGDSQGAIWMGGAAPVVDGSGNIWVATGNSAFTSQGDAYDDSDGVLELSASLVLEHFFAPSDWYDDNGQDFDLGSSSPALMADGLAFQAGKSQTGYAISQSSLGNTVGDQLSQLTNYCGNDVDGGSAVAGDVVYAPCENGIVATEVDPNSPYTITPLWQTSTQSGGPAIVAGGFVWTIGGGNLYGLDPSTGDAAQTFSIGPEATDFPTPSVADGLLLAPTANAVVAFDGPAGLPPPPSLTSPTVTSISPTSGTEATAVTIQGTALSGGSVDFGSTPATGVTCGPSSCTATAPAGSGTVDVTVTTTAGTSATTSADHFSYEQPSYEVGAEGTDGALWVRTDLTNWTSLGGGIIAAPAIAAIPQSSGPPVALFIVNGTDHRLYERTLSTSWTLLGPSSTYCLDNPAAVVTGTASSPSLTVACEGGDDALYSATVTMFPSTGLPNFGAWNDLGGSLGAGPAVAPVNGTISYFVTAGFNDGQVWTRTAATNWGATPWYCVGHPAAGIAQQGTTTWFGCGGIGGQLWAGPVSNGVGAQGGAIAPGVALGVDSAAAFMFAEASFGGGSVWVRTPTTTWADLGGSVLGGVGAVGFS